MLQGHNSKKRVLGYVNGVEIPKDDVRMPCLSNSELLKLSTQPLTDIPSQTTSHIEECPRCNINYMVFRAAYLLNNLPSSWSVNLEIAPQSIAVDYENGPVTVLGKISLETRRFSLCDGDGWYISLTDMRLKITVDRASKQYYVAVIDVPIAIKGIKLKSSDGCQPFMQKEDCFEFLSSCSEKENNANPLAFDDFIELFLSGHFQIEIEMGIASHDKASGLDGALIEHSGKHKTTKQKRDYGRPLKERVKPQKDVANSGISAKFMQGNTLRFFQNLQNRKFDVILTVGKKANRIARHFARQQDRKILVFEAIHDGCDFSDFINDILPGSHVLILSGNVENRQFIKRLSQMVRKVRANICGVVTLSGSRQQSEGPKRFYDTTKQRKIQVQNAQKPRKQHKPKKSHR